MGNMRLAVLINKRLCQPVNVSVKKRICCPDVELLAVGQRPYYLPRAISHGIIATAYIITDLRVAEKSKAEWTGPMN